MTELKSAKLKDCTQCWLIRSNDDKGQLLPIAPTAKKHTFEGEIFHRTHMIARRNEDGSFAGVYLGESYGQNLLKQIAARKAQERANSPAETQGTQSST